MSLPRQLSLLLANGKLLKFKKAEIPKKLSGTSEKSIYLNEDDPSNTPYYIKRPKPRTLEAILSKNVAPTFYKIREKLALVNLKNIPRSSPLQALINNVKKEIKYDEEQNVEHLQSLRDSQFFSEVISPRIAKAIFDDMLVVPENYFCRTADKSPLILSKGIDQFCEFLSKEEAVSDKTAVVDWKNKALPLRNQLHIDADKAYVLGVLFYVALLMGHLDLLNNINLTNAGFKIVNGKLYAAIVDWGNTLGIAFGGLTDAECALKNPDILTGKIDFERRDIAGFQHCVPFDALVYPLLPRQLVRDLFRLNGGDTISHTMFKGFKEASLIAKQKLNDLNTLIPNAIDLAFKEYTAEADIQYLKKILNHEMYFPDEKHAKDGYTLVNILKGRINSLEKMIKQLDDGVSLEQIAENRLSEIIKQQSFVSSSSYALVPYRTSFFAKPTEVSTPSHKSNNQQKIISFFYRYVEDHLKKHAIDKIANSQHFLPAITYLKANS